jgi:hypothetical protein
MPARTSFTQPRVIISEGEEDAAISRALLASHLASVQQFDVSPVIDIGGTGGNTGFQRAIISADAMSGFSGVSDVVLVADNDDPATSFTMIVAQIRSALASGLSRQWAVPTVPYVKAAGDPSVTIWLWPAQGQAGCLETLLWQLITAQTANRAAVRCVDQAVACAGIGGWPLSKLDKARVRCFIALTHRKSPAVPLARVWLHYPSLIRIRSTQFTPFLQLLRSI